MLMGMPSWPARFQSESRRGSSGCGPVGALGSGGIGLRVYVGPPLRGAYVRLGRPERTVRLEEYCQVKPLPLSWISPTPRAPARWHSSKDFSAAFSKSGFPKSSMLNMHHMSNRLG